MNTVRIARVPGQATDIELPTNATIADALATANITLAPNESVHVRIGNVAQPTDTIPPGAKLLILKPIITSRPHETTHEQRHQP